MRRGGSQPRQRWGQEVILVDPPNEDTKRLWEKLAELARQFGPDEEWCLVGGLMVQLHAFENDADARPTDDIDILGNARTRPSMTERLAEIIEGLGGTIALPPTTDPKIGYQFEIDGEIVEVLGPDGLGKEPRTLGHKETIQVDGGTQALRRTEKVVVSVAGGSETEIRRPTLLGAILLKARALARVQARFDEHREDLIRLLSFVHDPRVLATDGRITKNERKWLRTVESDLKFDDPMQLHQLSQIQVERASQAFELLSR